MAFHVNPNTGNPGVCKAKIACRFGGSSDHYDTEESARNAFERKMGASESNINLMRNELASLIPYESSTFNSIEFRSNWIHEYPSEWENAAKENLYDVLKMQELLTQSTMTSDDWKNVDDIFSHLQVEAAADPNNIGRQGLINQINGLGQDLIIQRQAYDAKWAYDTPNRPEMEGVEGLAEAQQEVVRSYNRDFGPADSNYLMGAEVPAYMDQTIDRIVGGEKYKLKNTPEEGYALSLLPERDRLMSVLSDPESPNFNSRMYLSTVFPEKELKSVMDREGLRDVTVDRFNYNGNEQGLSYSVAGSDGESRSFKVSEDSESIRILAEKPNDIAATPFEIKFPKDQREHAAEALVFFMKESQNDEHKNGRQDYGYADHREWKSKFDNSEIGY